jgi:transposase
MYEVHLDDAARLELRRRARQHSIAPRLRQRLEMVRLADMGWSVPRIAAHLQVHHQTARYWIKAYLGAGFDALVDRAHTGKPSAITAPILTAVRQMLEKGERTWTAAQVADWVAREYGIRRSNAHWRRLLQGLGQSYKRTKSRLRHKQKPEEVAAKKAEMAALQQKGALNCSTYAISMSSALL